MDLRPIIAVPMGDPAGVGPEIIIKALANNTVNKVARVVLIGDGGIITRATGFPNMPQLKINVVCDPKDGDYRTGVLNLIDLNNIPLENAIPGVISAACGKAAYEYIERAVDLVMNGIAAAVSTTPINKESLHAAHVPYIGHTEIFGALTHTSDPLTIFSLRDTLVFFLTRHVSLKKSCDMIKKDRIIDYVKRSFVIMEQLGIKNPSMAVAGLNPHCGEHGLFGNEEVDEVIPAVEWLRSAGYPVLGPIGADSVFFQAFEGRYNAVLSLYHDQGHIATKSVDFYRTISVTGGMPILRTSVDHGTAFDIAGKGIATGIGMEEAILVAAKYAPSFQKSR